MVDHQNKPHSDAESDSIGISRLDGILPVGDYEEVESVDGQQVRRKGVYIVPNLFTTAAMFSAFYSIIHSMSGDLEKAAIAVFVSMFMDILDGRFARWLNAQSAFGAQYDSLADMVSFGVAPSLMMFSWALSSLGKFGWAISFIYVACAALRLARFNTQVATADKRFFTGLASPGAAAVLASLVWIANDYALVSADLPKWLAILAAVITAIVGLLMVSNVRYYSFKGINLKGRVPFAAMIIIMLVIAVVSIDPPAILLTLLVIYALSGPMMMLKSDEK